MLRTDQMPPLLVCLALAGCGPVVEGVVAVDETCAPAAADRRLVGVLDLALPAAYRASLLVSGGAPEEATVWVVDGSVSNAPGGPVAGELAGLPTPDRPRQATLTQEADMSDGTTVLGLELLTSEEVDVIDTGVLGAQVGFDRNETYPLTIGVKPSGAPTFHFSLELCRGCLVDDTCAQLTRSCRPSQDTPNPCL